MIGSLVLFISSGINQCATNLTCPTETENPFGLLARSWIDLHDAQNVETAV